MKLFKLPSGASYYGDQKVIDKDVLGTFIDLENLIEDAHKELESLRSQFIEMQTQEVEKKKEEAYLEALTIFNQHVFALDAELKTLKTNLLKQVLPLALNAAKKIVGSELKTHPETIIAIIQKELKACASCRKVKILVSKEDKALADEHRADLRSKLDQIETFAIEDSEDISPGSCMILTEAGNINASLDMQWKALEEAFKRYMKPS
jgi:type III secretion protein L